MSIINIPPAYLIRSAIEDRQFIHQGIVYKPGDLIRMKIFNTVDQFRLFYSEENKMIMFNDDVTGKDYNILGYLENIV